MSGQEWRDYIVPISMNRIGEKPKRLRRVTKAMQEENSVRIPLLQLDPLGARSYPGIVVWCSHSVRLGSHGLLRKREWRIRFQSVRRNMIRESVGRDLERHALTFGHTGIHQPAKCKRD
jgi:hypothetical protein